MPGSDRLARTARHSTPRSWMTASARVRLAEMQKKGRGRSSINVVGARCSARSRSTLRPDDNATSGSVGRMRRPLRAKASTAISTRSASVRPWAQMAPMTAPMLVPPMTSMGTPASSSARITPR